MRLIALTTIACVFTASAHAAIISADTATASSEFNGNYLATNTINGSGMPLNFGPGDTHAQYAVRNHWTTTRNDTVGAHITWGFNAPVTIGGMYIWNHLSNGVASNAYYAPTLFNLELFDAGANSLGGIFNVAMNHSTNLSQDFDLGALYANVASARFTVLQTRAELDGVSLSTRYTGLAEVLFSDARFTPDAAVVPVPGAALLLLSGLAGLAFASRRRTATKA